MANILYLEVLLKPPTSGMTAEAKGAGVYFHELMGRNYDRIQIITVRQIIEDHIRLKIQLVWKLLRAPNLEPAGADGDRGTLNSISHMHPQLKRPCK